MLSKQAIWPTYWICIIELGHRNCEHFINYVIGQMLNFEQSVRHLFTYKDPFTSQSMIYALNQLRDSLFGSYVDADVPSSLLRSNIAQERTETYNPGVDAKILAAAQLHVISLKWFLTTTGPDLHLAIYHPHWIYRNRNRRIIQTHPCF